MNNMTIGKVVGQICWHEQKILCDIMCGRA